MPGLSDIILQAFIARRQLVHESPDFTGLRVIGSRYSTDTFRVRDFLARNRVLFTWVDVETDPQVDLLLKQFGVTEADTPVVACARMLLLRNPSNQTLADEIGIRRPLEQWYTIWSWWGRARRGWRPRSTARPKACGRWCWNAAAGRAGGQQHADRELSRLSHRASPAAI